MATIFYLGSRADKAGDHPICVSISIKGQRLVTSIGFSINSMKWDIKKQRARHGVVTNKGVQYSQINTRINGISLFFSEYESNLKTLLTPITLQDIKAAWENNFKSKPIQITVEETADLSLLDYFDKFVKESSKVNGWAKGTIDKFKYVKKHITDYTNKPTFEIFSKNELPKYVDHLRDKKQLRNSTLHKHLSLLRWFLRWVERNDIAKIDFVNHLPKLKMSDTKIIFLNWEELMRVYNEPIPEAKGYLTKVRDVFCFCCFTSLRYSDVANLKRSDIIDNTIHLTTVKTSSALRIELNKYSKTILDKYKDIPFENGKALPIISNQRMNDYLKELGKLCELNEPQTLVYFRGKERIDETYPKHELLTTHAGRRTFICNALALGIPAHVVMKWTGHSDYKAMKPYIDVADSIKSEAMNKFNDI